ncbi:MAG: hypothetical protein HOQ30_07450 [Gemmatimonadaceae bacterium]|nr:hypothetical protein [Gemmatimonadaceae bacterium]
MRDDDEADTTAPPDCMLLVPLAQPAIVNTAGRIPGHCRRRGKVEHARAMKASGFSVRDERRVELRSEQFATVGLH